MCKFFSLVSDGEGKAYYFDSKIRKQILNGKLNYNTDSHTSIADYFGFKAEKEDKLNKYEFNPLTGEFTVDQINTKNDAERIKALCMDLDFKKIVPELVIKKIVYQLKDFNVKEVSKKDVELLKKWASVRDSVWDSVRDSVWASVRDSVRDSVGASVWASVRASVWFSVWDSVWDSVGASVWASVWDSVGDSVWDSVRDSVGAYMGSFVDTKYKYNFKPCQELWNKGIVPSFDGKIWRLHRGKGKIILEVKKEELKSFKLKDKK